MDRWAVSGFSRLSVFSLQGFSEKSWLATDRAVFETFGSSVFVCYIEMRISKTNFSFICLFFIYVLT